MKLINILSRDGEANVMELLKRCNVLKIVFLQLECLPGLGKLSGSTFRVFQSSEKHYVKDLKEFQGLENCVSVLQKSFRARKIVCQYFKSILSVLLECS